MLDVFLKSFLLVHRLLFFICGAVMFVQSPAEALCGLIGKVLIQRNVIGIFFPCDLDAKPKDAGSLPQITQVIFCFLTTEVLSARDIYMFQQLKLCPNISRIWTIRKKLMT